MIFFKNDYFKFDEIKTLNIDKISNISSINIDNDLPESLNELVLD